MSFSVACGACTSRFLQSHSSPSSAFRRPAAIRRAVSSSRRCRGQPVQVQALFGGKKDGGGGNPFGDMGALMENVKKAQQLVQVEAAKAQEELANTVIEGYSSDETVCVTMSGNQEPRSTDITEDAYARGAEELSVLVTEAMKDAHSKSVNAMKTRMSGLASQLGLPGMPQQ